ncbi:DUF1285 domain-containing protein [Pseudoalteromonas fenneropenaei]|uniref:DUF1285 domain-containing protein n=1 Tax=Pseudoalteromonas fenneropenaei TaxID=1737459 RepID=A0ABV7CJZ3_9GAMM
MQSLADVMLACAPPLGPKAQWQPASCANLTLSIDNEGQWWHEGQPVVRTELARLWASVLQVSYRQPERLVMSPDASNPESYQEAHYELVTPVERVAVAVADVPFVIVSWRSLTVVEGEVLIACDNLGREWPLCAEYPLLLLPYQRQLLPYLQLNQGLLARVQRNVFYQWAQLAEYEAQQWWIRSAGQRFVLAYDEDGGAQ